jgi:hypothetical protein
LIIYHDQELGYFIKENSDFMIKKNLANLLVAVVILSFTGCHKSNDFQKDVETVADGMCRITEVMNKLRAADQADSVGVAKLQGEAQRLESEMIRINEAFREKYKSRLADESFRKDYSREMRKAILNCPHLSKEDRERFEKEAE